MQDVNKKLQSFQEIKYREALYEKWNVLGKWNFLHYLIKLLTKPPSYT